ncbi:MAG TPA: aldo/keto reductase [candidate division Zixibacteria bacterium]|nr:aldo/keto reductase [candidate division Zixibacteria bacterium]
MEKRKLGKTGIKTTILGFGAMRLPVIEIGKSEIKHDEAIKIIRQGIDSGINYVDTAYNYHDYESEIVVGKALKDGYREKVSLATKCPIWDDKEFTKSEDLEKFLDDSLRKLDVEYLDVYLLHALNKKRWDEKVLPMKLIDEGMKVKDKGKIKHLGFSFHDKPEVLKEILEHPDSSKFDVMLIQYNLLDKQYEEMIQLAVDKGLGVAVMGPIAGGRLAGNPPEDMQKLLTKGRTNFADLALRFVWSNPYISVALSGMGSEEMVTDNLAIANIEKLALNEDEIKKTEEIITRFKEKTDNICTSCKYCEPCPNEVEISFIFRSLILAQVYGDMERGKLYYSKIGEEDWPPGKRADACIECGECEPKCPQKIEIIDQLKKAHKILSA